MDFKVFSKKWKRTARKHVGKVISKDYQVAVVMIMIAEACLNTVVDDETD